MSLENPKLHFANTLGVMIAPDLKERTYIGSAYYLPSLKQIGTLDGGG